MIIKRMKTRKLVAIVLMLGVCTGFYSCKKDYVIDLLPTPPTTITDVDRMFMEYYTGDYSHIKYRLAISSTDLVLLSGIKNKHLWFSEFDSSTKNLKRTWEDMEETDTIQQVYEGDGKYSEKTIETVILKHYKETKAGNIVTFELNSYPQTIFTSHGKCKRTKLESGYFNMQPYDWYNESIFTHGGCYSSEGDLIYAIKNYSYDFSAKDMEPLSYEEGIKFNHDSSLSFERFNIKENKSIWRTFLNDIEYSSSSEVSYTILDKSAGQWKYRVAITARKGMTRTYIFKVDIEDGKVNVAEEGVKVTGVTLNESELKLEVGETFQLVATVQPEKAENSEVIWSSSDESVAAVDQNGLVTAHSDGEAIISVTTKDGGFSATSHILIKAKEVSDYITSEVTNSLINIGGYVKGVVGSKIINNSTEEIRLKSFTVLDDKGEVLFTKSYTDMDVKGGGSYKEVVEIEGVLQEVTIRWTYTHHDKEYNYTVKVPV